MPQLHLPGKLLTLPIKEIIDKISFLLYSYGFRLNHLYGLGWVIKVKGIEEKEETVRKSLSCMCFYFSVSMDTRGG